MTAVFPGPERLAVADLTALGMPGARARALSALAASAAADPQLFDRDQDLDTAIARLKALPGIGEWTAQYIALRALREPDAFPAADIGLLRAMAGPDGVRPTPAQLLARAEAWRPAGRLQNQAEADLLEMASFIAHPHREEAVA